MSSVHSEQDLYSRGIGPEHLRSPPLPIECYQEQIRYCFSVYDLTGKGIIAKEEMTTLLQKCLKLQGQEEEGEDGVKVEEDDICHDDLTIDIDCVPQDIIDLTLKKMDVDKDGRICFDDYEETVKNEPLLLEAFGPCLPKATTLDLFMRQVLKRPDGISTLKNYYLGLT